MKTLSLLNFEYDEITNTVELEYKPKNQDFQHVIIDLLDFINMWIDLELTEMTIEYIEANFWRGNVRTLIEMVLKEYQMREYDAIIREQFFNLN